MDTVTGNGSQKAVYREQERETERERERAAFLCNRISKSSDSFGHSACREIDERSALEIRDKSLVKN